MVHAPRTKRAAHKIEPGKQVLDSPSHGITGLKAEEPITVGPKRLPDSPFPKRVSPIPYHRPGTPYRRVDRPGGEIAPETLETGILDKTDDSFEIDSESERTLTEEPKEPKTPKFQINRGETPEGITRRKLIPVVLPFDSDTGKGLKSKTETKLQVNPRETRFYPGKGPEKKSKATEKPHEKPIKETVEAPKAPIVRSPSRSPSASSVSTPSSHSTLTLITPIKSLSHQY